MKILAFLLISLWMNFSLAGTAKVVLLKGEASFGGQKLTSSSKLKGNGEVVMGDKSYLKLLLDESNTTIVLGANTTSKINFADAADLTEVSLVKGAARWITGGKKGKGITTSGATMGIRGTDFFASYNPLLGETEIICFDGEVEFTNAEDKSDSKTIKKNQWGGIGGRFGKKLSEVLSLTPELISIFDGALPK